MRLELVFGPVFGRPVQIFGLDANASLLHRLIVILDNLLVQHNDVLALVVADDVQVLQSGYDVLFLDAGLFAQLLYANRRPVVFAVLLGRQVNQNVQYGHRPVPPVAQQAQIGQRLLGRARLGLYLGQLVAELD